MEALIAVPPAETVSVSPLLATGPVLVTPDEMTVLLTGDNSYGEIMLPYAIIRGWTG